MAWWMVPAIGGGNSLLGYVTRKKRPGFGKTPLGQELSRVGKEGMYSPEMRGQIMGQVGSQTGNVAEQTKATLRGYLASRGMDNSVAGVRTLASPDLNRQRIMGDTGANLNIQNEQSKANAKMQYAQARTNWGEQGRQEENAARGQLLGGLGNAGMSAVNGYQGYTQGLEYNKGIAQVQALMDSGKTDDAENLLMMLMARYGNAGQ